jgi:hypothetical protein
MLVVSTWPRHTMKGISAMDRDAEDIGIFLFFLAATTIMAAFTLGYVAHYNFGLSRQEIRTLALTAAAIIGLLVATGYFRKELRERR